MQQGTGVFAFNMVGRTARLCCSLCEQGRWTAGWLPAARASGSRWHAPSAATSSGHQQHTARRTAQPPQIASKDQAAVQECRQRQAALQKHADEAGQRLTVIQEGHSAHQQPAARRVCSKIQGGQGSGSRSSRKVTARISCSANPLSVSGSYLGRVRGGAMHHELAQRRQPHMTSRGCEQPGSRR